MKILRNDFESYQKEKRFDKLSKFKTMKSLFFSTCAFFYFPSEKNVKNYSYCTVLITINVINYH